MLQNRGKMTIRHLNIFVTVAECGKMRVAADMLHISQPSVSQAISELENYYNVKLFERISQRIYITEQGKELLTYARTVVDAFDEMEEFMHSSSTKNRIRVGGSVTIGTVIIPRIMEELEKDNSSIDVRVTVDNTTNIEELIENNELDIALVEGIVKNTNLIRAEVLEDELVMVVGKRHPFFTNPTVELKDLANQTLLSREKGSAERNQFEQFLSDNSISMDVKWSCSNTETIKQALCHEAGIAILSKLLVQKEVESGSLKILHVKSTHINRKIRLLYHKNKYFTHAMKTFMDYCQDLNNILKD